MKAFEQKELSNLNNTIIHGWYAEYFARERKLKKIDEYMIKEKDKKENKNKMDRKEMKEHYQSKVVR